MYFSLTAAIFIFLTLSVKTGPVYLSTIFLASSLPLFVILCKGGSQ